MTSRFDYLLQQAAQLYPTEIDLSLDRCYRLLNDLRNPHLHMPPVIHVAGTNGKGSTLAFVGDLLRLHGKSFHRYTSPHLVHFRERIRLAGEKPGQFIADDETDALIADALQHVLNVNDGKPITQFEIITCAAFYLFAKIPADFTLVEVGMGGRLDATNVISNPAVTAIASIGYDHMAELGWTLAKIAHEKAGIIKPGVPVIVPMNMASEALAVIGVRAAQQNAPVIRAEVYQNDLGLKGDHQRFNSGVALAIVQALNIPLKSEVEIAHALRQTRWPGRFQMIPIKGKSMILDGAHNADGMKALSETLKIEFAHVSDLVLFVHIKERKDLTTILPYIAPLAKMIYCVTMDLPGGEAAAAEQFQEVLESFNVPIKTIINFNQFERAIEMHDESLIATGSLFWIGTILEHYEITC